MVTVLPVPVLPNRGNAFQPAGRVDGMVLTRLVGGLTALGVAVGVVGSLAGLAGLLPSSRGSVAVLATVVVVMAVVAGAGLLDRANGGNPYW